MFGEIVVFLHRNARVVILATPAILLVLAAAPQALRLIG